MPGGALIDASVHTLVEHTGPADAATLDAAEGAIQVLETIKGTEIADEVQFPACCARSKRGSRSYEHH